MKRVFILTIIVLLLTGTAAVYAAAPLDQPGVSDGYLYKEVIFITGEPVVVTGSLKVSESARRDYVTTRCTYNLENKEKGITVKRNLTLKTQLDVKQDIGQTVSTMTLDRFSETITTQGARYKLEDYVLNGSRITHNKPVADFFSGNWQGKKTYSIGGGGSVVIETIGEEVGYGHYWGAVTTRQVDGFINVYRDMADEDGDIITADWDGEFGYRMSTTVNKYLSYVANQPSQISFRGGYLLTEEEENLIDYSYDLPRFDAEGFPRRRQRDEGRDSLVLKTVPKYERLVIPEVKDVGGHWAENDIKALYSLGVFPQGSSYFGPRLPMLRSDFARAIVEATKLIVDDGASSGRNQPAAKGTFEDVSETHPDYKYIMEVEKRGIIMGVSPGQFVPDGKLTRAQAITIIMRALGFDNMAPNPGYKTEFVDDDQIPYWAKDSIYAAREIGLVNGDSYGYVYPNDVMTRAEAAAFIYRFVRYLQSDIKRDYRDRILNY